MTDALAALRRTATSRSARTAFLIVMAAAAGIALIAQRDQMMVGLARITGWQLAAAFSFVLLNLLCTAASWRAVVSDLGGTTTAQAAGRIFFVGQVAKYVPGGIWNFVAAAELGRDAGLPRGQTVATFLIALAIGLATGSLVTALFLPLVNEALFARYWWAVLAVPSAVAVLHPSVLGRLLAIGRVQVERPLSIRGSAVSAAWAIIAWLMLGAQLWILAGAVGAPLDWSTFALAAGGCALAWVVGFLFMIAPAGLGPREAVLTIVLTMVLQPGDAFLVALLSRLLMTLADVAAAGAVLAITRRPAAI